MSALLSRRLTAQPTATSCISCILTLADISGRIYTDKTTVRKNTVTEDAKSELQKEIWTSTKSSRLKAAAAAEHHLHRRRTRRRCLTKSSQVHDRDDQANIGLTRHLVDPAKCLIAQSSRGLKHHPIDQAKHHPVDPAQHSRVGLIPHLTVQAVAQSSRNHSLASTPSSTNPRASSETKM
jgi:hypothetical protein